MTNTETEAHALQDAQDAHQQAQPGGHGSSIHQLQLGRQGSQNHVHDNNSGTPLDSVAAPTHSSSNVVEEYNTGPVGLSGINWMSPQGYSTTADWGGQFTDFLKQDNGSEHYNNPFPSLPATEIPPSDYYPGYLGHLAGISTSTNSAAQYHQPSSGINLSSAHSQSSENTSKSSHTTEGNYYADGSGYRAPFGGRSKKRYSIANVDVLQPDDEAVTEDLSTRISHRTVLMAAYEIMTAGITSEIPFHIGQETPMPPIPSFEQTQFFVQQYFEHFHKAFPFLRRSSLFQETAGDFKLLLAVVAIGSRYSRRLHGSRVSDFLLDTLLKSLRRTRYGLGTDRHEVAPFAPGRSVRTVAARPLLQTSQAGVLAIMASLHCGVKTNLDQALIDRHYLVETCSSLGLLSPRSAPSTHGPDAGRVNVLFWSREQAEIRTGMMIWVGSVVS